jgi:hypothetical protein
MANIVNLSKKLMFKQTQKNKAPAWLSTELAINKGKKLAKKYNVDEELVSQQKKRILKLKNY